MESLKITLDPNQIDKAARELIKKQQSEIARLKRKVDSLEFELNNRKRKDAEMNEMKSKFERAKDAIADLLGIDASNERRGNQ